MPVANRRFDDDDFDDAQDDRRAKCCCCPISMGMSVSAFIIAAMTTANIFYMLFTIQGSAPLAQMAGALMRNSGALILWLIGTVAAGVMVFAPTIKHPISGVQMANLSLFCSLVFAIVVIYHGYTAANDAFLGDAVNQTNGYIGSKVSKAFPGLGQTTKKAVGVGAQFGFWLVLTVSNLLALS
jgi:hypothetical protein